MSDNVAITPGTGATVAADLIGGALHQRVKLSFGADGSAADWDGTQHIGEVGGRTVVIKPTVTIDTAIYAALDCLGAAATTSVVTLTGAMRISGGSGMLQSLTVFDDTGTVKNPITLLFFDSAPASGTYTGNGALALSAGDKAKYIGRVDILASDYVTMGGDAFVCLRNIGMGVKASGSADLFVIPMVTSGTPDYAASTDLVFTFTFLQD